MNIQTVMVLALCGAAAASAVSVPARSDAAGQTVLATTFPICQIVRNVTQGRDGLTVDLLLPARTGCPHDYALTPRDMRKLARAAILVTNGLGLETFAGVPVKKANPRMKVIDSSAGIREILAYSDDQRHDHGDEHDHADAEEDAGANPHLFASPRMQARLAMNIAAGLAEADPDGAAVYFGNARAYAARMNMLADDMAALGRRLKNNRIVQPHGVFDYLARDMGLEIVAVMQSHGREPSAAEMMRLVRLIRAKQAGAVFTEPQYPDRIGAALSRETGIPVAVLDPAATGPESAPLTYYETVMRRNMQTLGQTLGGR